MAKRKRYGQTTYLELVKDPNSLFVNPKRWAHIVQLVLTQEDKIIEKQALIHSQLGHLGHQWFNYCIKNMKMSELKLNKHNTILEDSYEICIYIKQMKKQNHT